ncbi:MAG: substrate-binding domain-containing protein [Blautia massiliensis (ex Durand et al. 2017)]
MEELERQGKKIPEDVAVTGYDNSLYARHGQGITTITHPQEKLGDRCLSG